MAAGDTVPTTVLNEEAEALDADVDSMAADDAAPPTGLNEDAEALAAEATEDALRKPVGVMAATKCVAADGVLPITQLKATSPVTMAEEVVEPSTMLESAIQLKGIEIGIQLSIKELPILLDQHTSLSITKT